MVHPLGRSVCDFDSWNKTKKKKWIKQILLQALEKTEALHNINDRIVWVIMHKEYGFEKSFLDGFLELSCFVDGSTRTVEELAIQLLNTERRCRPERQRR